MSAPLSAGFIPLVDAAPLVIAREIGFAEEEGLALDLRPAASWATLRDMVSHGQVEAAHMLAPMPVASALGLGGAGVRLDVLQVLSVNGNAIGVSTALAEVMRAAGHSFDFADAAAAGRALLAARPEGLRIGVPFPFSGHAELLYHWLGALGFAVPQALSVHTVPPPLMADALAAGEVDAFCVGAPWGTLAVESGAGELLLPGTAIRRFAPEKVLAVRHDWADAEPELTGRLMRAIWRANRWLGQPQNRTTASEILARSAYLDTPAELIERALSGRLIVSQKGDMRTVPRYLEFFEGAATFPWRSTGALIADRIAARTGLDRPAAQAEGRRVFRSDLYRHHLARTTADMPGASERLEGALAEDTPVASPSGRLTLAADSFFDGFIFDPQRKT
ncbi:CmpA/NrtA family ABC transporter substrate-binding protein [Vannielia litorea]|uniref:CmpA/NrtA family ABC transporter substrate-binding protein n=1 Tax=Vannielia TaxID=2813041 RepID=UPI001C9392FF|nr:CmpA/NrtA family ABC transporter substrate-binding protein [Vannielia litorea]MBY6046232.1 ABC transporter substrate-binding protein [Vannielia litorea]MBY6073645.1 ABC transporter substrate-binding protein [Vannielia litorea]